MGDWNVRGLDLESKFTGKLDDRLINASMIAKKRLNDSYPDWWVFSVVVRGEMAFYQRLNDFTVMMAHLLEFRKNVPSEVRTVGAWIALSCLINPSTEIHLVETSEKLGCHPDTLKRVIDRIYYRMHLRLDLYLYHLRWGYCETVIREKEVR